MATYTIIPSCWRAVSDMTFIKIFKGYPCDIENNINEIAHKRNLKIVSCSSCINQGTLYVTVAFEKRDGE